MRFEILFSEEPNPLRRGMILENIRTIIAIIAANSPFIPIRNKVEAVIKILNCPKRITKKVGNKFQLLADA